MPHLQQTALLPESEMKRLVIAGASTRAAAVSARRAGYAPLCADLFADADLQQIAEVRIVENSPAGYVDAARTMPPSCWMYTGALENHPRVVAEVSKRHRLLGNPAEVLQTIRDPFAVCETLRQSGLNALDVCPANDPPPRNGEWLRKPIRSAGGRGIIVWNETSQQTPADDERHVFQRRATGTPMSAVFLSSRLQCRLMGFTRQLVGESELHARPFAYCGSVGPVQLPPRLEEQITRIGRVLADAFELRGLFGIDCRVDATAAHVVEVNPRYTASCEVLEYALGCSLVELHAIACQSCGQSATETSPADAERTIDRRLNAGRENAFTGMIGKAILFAEEQITAPPLPVTIPPKLQSPDAVSRLAGLLADVPAAGTRFRPGDPVCTVFAFGRTTAECLNALFLRVREMDRTLQAGGGS